MTGGKTMQQIVICDDNPEVLLSVKKMVDELWKTPHQTTGLFSWEALERYLTVEAPGRADILLLDIMLGDQNGIDLSRRLLERWPRMRVIFMTGYIELCEEIFQGRPTAFLVKPVKPEKLLFALDKAERELEENDAEYLTVLDRTQNPVRISLRRMEYAESKSRVVRIRTDGQMVECGLRMGELELQLPEQFIRCHQSYLVNLEYVRRLEQGKLLLLDGERIPVSRTRIKEIRERLVELARGCL